MSEQRNDGDYWVARVSWRKRLTWNWWRSPFPHLFSRWEVRRAFYPRWRDVPGGTQVPDAPLAEGWAGFTSFRRRPAEDWLYELAGITDDEAGAWGRAQAGKYDPDAWLEAYRARNKG